MPENDNPFFSVIIVCLNPGNRLKMTLESVDKQTFHDFEVLVKDGLSTDGSWEDACRLAELWAAEDRGRETVSEGGGSGETSAGRETAGGKAARSLRVIRKKDTGIYDAMNQGAMKARGRYVYFLNCGDLFYSETVLEEMAEFIGRESPAGSADLDFSGDGGGVGPGIYYGNIFERLTGQKVASNPRMDAFGCYRNVPCHQACFYSRELLTAHPFETRYRVRADYEQFLWCFFERGKKGQAVIAWRDMMIADYEGGGFSETRENRRVSEREHREIAGKYFSKRQLLGYRLVMLLSFASLRTALAENKRTAGVYNRLKKMLYSFRR